MQEKIPNLVTKAIIYVLEAIQINAMHCDQAMSG